MPATINDHDKLHEAVLRATLAAGAAAVAGMFLPASAAAALVALAIGCAVVVPNNLPSAASALLWAIGGEAPAARAAADDLVGKMTRFGTRWRELESEASRSLPGDLRERLQLVGRRLETSSDPLARAELARAREALSAQLAYLEEIHSGRERAVARLEHQVATLERLRLAALRHRPAHSARMGA